MQNLFFCLALSIFSAANVQNDHLPFFTADNPVIRYTGDSKVHFYSFSKRYHNGCGRHLTVSEHQEISGGLTAYLKELMK